MPFASSCCALFFKKPGQGVVTAAKNADGPVAAQAAENRIHSCQYKDLLLLPHERAARCEREHTGSCQHSDLVLGEIDPGGSAQVSQLRKTAIKIGITHHLSTKPQNVTQSHDSGRSTLHQPVLFVDNIRYRHLSFPQAIKGL